VTLAVSVFRWAQGARGSDLTRVACRARRLPWPRRRRHVPMRAPDEPHGAAHAAHFFVPRIVHLHLARVGPDLSKVLVDSKPKW
jgi:hypothetical protein